jgi:hypothetical protein
VSNSVRVNSVLVEQCGGGIRIGTVHGNHKPGEVERADILDTIEAIGKFIAQADLGPSYAGHLAGKAPAVTRATVAQELLELAHRRAQAGDHRGAAECVHAYTTLAGAPIVKAAP